MIEILQTEESTHSTMQQIQGYEKKPPASIYYQSYDSRSKKSKSPSNEQNSSSSSYRFQEEMLSMWWNHSADNTWKNARLRISYVMVVVSKAISRNVARSQVTSQKIVLIDRISLLHPQVQARWTLPVQLLRYKQISSMRKGSWKNTILSILSTSIQAVCIILRKVPRESK